jgi:hypothetical protein
MDQPPTFPPKPPGTDPLLTTPAKVLLALLVIAGIVFTVIRVAPELPDLAEDEEGEGDPNVVITSGDGPETAPVNVASTSGLRLALAAVREEAGDGTRLTRLIMTPDFATFTLVRGRGADDLRFDGRTRELSRDEALIIGTGSLRPESFPLRRVRPAVVDLLVRKARRSSGLDDFTIVSMLLQRNAIDGRLFWVLDGQGGGRVGLTYHASLDGSDFDDLSPRAGGLPGIRIPEQAQEALERAECVREAGTDVEAVLACLEGFVELP